MRSLPADWPTSGYDSTNDQVFVSVPDAQWLDDDTEVLTASIKRDLVGSLLPGQVRSTSGMSVAEGSCSFAYDATQGAPWRQGAHKVKPEGVASLYAQARGGTSSIPLARFGVDRVGAALSQASIDLELIDEKIANRKLNSFFGYIGDQAQPIDPAWVVDTIARGMGFYSTPAPVPSCALAVPMNGSILAEAQIGALNAVYGYPSGWDESLGNVSPVGSVTAQYETSKKVPFSSFFVTATFVGSFGFVAAAADSSVQFVAEAGTLTVATLYSVPPGAVGSYVAGDDPEHPNRLQIHCQRLGTPGAWTGFRARARSSATSPWSAWVTDTSGPDPSMDSSFTTVSMGTAETGSMIGFQLSAADDPGLWGDENASVYSLGNSLGVASIEADKDEWAAIQDVVASNMGAAWLDADGKLVVRNFAWLRGARPVDADLNVLDDLDDLKWTVDSQDICDRIEVTYRPADIKYVPNGDYLFWESPEALELKTNTTIELVVDVPLYANVTRWQADINPARDGSGVGPTNALIDVTVAKVNSRRAKITITSRYAATLYTVNSAGEPSLRLYATHVVDQETEVVVSAGASPDQALSPISINLGVQCQTAEDAERILGFVRSQTSSPRFKVESVLVPFDWRRELGDIYRLHHDGVDLNQKVLCTGITTDLQPGNYSQHLDLALLDISVYDFNEAWKAAPSHTIADFNAVWAGKTIADFNADPLRTA